MSHIIDPAPQTLKTVHILNGRRCDDKLEIVYSGRVRVCGDQAVVDGIGATSASGPVHRVVRGQGFSLDISISYGDQATQIRYSSLYKTLVSVLSTANVCILSQRTECISDFV